MNEVNAFVKMSPCHEDATCYEETALVEFQLYWMADDRWWPFHSGLL